MSVGIELIPADDERRGWFKLVIPGIDDVFGPIISKANFELLGFVYGKIETDQAAFDVELSVPFIVLSRVLLAHAIRDKSGGVKAELFSIRAFAPEHENRCYIPSQLVTSIIPLDPRSPLLQILVAATSESMLVMPSGADVGKIVDLAGNPLNPTEVK